MEIFDYKNLTDEELCGQTLCLDITSIGSEEEIKRRILENKPGGIYVHNMPSEKVKEYAAYANSICKYPVLVVADVENGPGSVFFEQESLPHPMAWGACLCLWLVAWLLVPVTVTEKSKTHQKHSY